MRYFSLISVVLLLLLFSGCKVEFVSRADNSKVYASGSACGSKREQVQENAVNALIREYPLIAEDLKPYVKINKVDANRTLCYDAVITKKAWSRFSDTLQNRKDEINKYSEKNQKVFEYNNKDILIKTMITERRQFNNKLASAKKLAPVDIEPFAVDYNKVKKSINVLPSAKIIVRSCNKNKNYNCPVTFVAEVNDESKNLTYAWDFGDGSKSEKKNPIYTYNEEGRYNVSLEVTDETGLSTYRSKDILVSKSKQRQETGRKNNLKAYFIMHQKSYTVNSLVEFDNRSQSDYSKIKSYLWKFGDDTESTERNPKHRYKKEGKYVVKYKVCTNDDVCAYASTSVNVVPKPQKTKPVTAKKTSVKKTSAKKTSVKKTSAKKIKRAAIDAKAGEDIQAYIASHGQPSKKIIKKKGTTKAYKYGNIWLLAKRGRIECAVLDKGLSTNLMGQPKKCHWHEKHAKQYMVDLQE